MINVLFTLGLMFLATAQVIAYLRGPRTRPRFIRLCFGIGAVVLPLAAGRMAAGHVRSYTNSPNTEISGDVPEAATASLVQQAVPIASVIPSILRLAFTNSTVAGNLVTLEDYSGSAPLREQRLRDGMSIVDPNYFE